MVIVDEEEEEDNISTAPARVAGQNEQVDRTSHRHLVQSGPSFDDISDYGNDIEEEMIQAAIEASKKDAELQKQQDLNHDGPRQRQLHIEDCGVAHAVSFSLKTEEQEGAVGGQAGTVRASGPSDNKPVKVEGLDGKDESNGRQSIDSFHITSAQPKNVAGSSSAPYEVEELEEQPLVRNRSRCLPAGSSEAHKEVEVIEVSPPPSPQHATATDSQLNGNPFHSDEWGGISSEEHDEAVMLEAAMFGGIPEQSEFHFPYAPHQFMQSGFDGTRQAPRPPSPGLAAQRLIREQQDDEYLASLQADREKELKAMEEEKAARQATLEEQQRKVEESRKKFEEEQELERQLAAKEASLPEEPAVDDENAVTLLVRMPDGSRHGRRFLKTDKLESLFNFIDVGRGVKSGTYRVVRPFPRRAFSDGDSNLSLNELGLTSKQEALFLELI
ncbi:hypothetical protein Nepgr_011263 [Nepenthes gracilis]|uniref:UBX domain-containing protein n=1 Tax=Nepenthes gracilis TaxID=150966 RepID=A0AAD3SF09_NEPGR|nr:hypothetical protein Nepgr_011263 [Nepenthes gracilis]